MQISSWSEQNGKDYLDSVRKCLDEVHVTEYMAINNDFNKLPSLPFSLSRLLSK